METPTGRAARPSRTATPRLSERKKQLFRSRSSMMDQIEDDGDVEDPLLGIAPLKPRHLSQLTKGTKKPNNRCNLFESVGDRDDQSSMSSSPETNKENKTLRKTRGSAISAGTEEQLPHLFTKTMRIHSNSSTSQSHSSSPRTPQGRGRVVNADESSTDTDDSATGKQRKVTKRAHEMMAAVTIESSPESATTSPKCKWRRTQKECIPTMAFYSCTTSTQSASRRSGSLKSVRRTAQQQRVGKTKATSPPFRPRLGINKGVHHGIRKPQRTGASINLDDILGSLRNEKLRNMIITKREELAKVEEVHNILRSAKDPIKMAKPLSVIALDDANNNNNNNNKETEAQFLSAVDFSDLSDDEELHTPSTQAVAMELEPIIPIIRHSNPTDTSPKADPPNNRKFFKSGKRNSTCMEVRITDNIRASVSQGKISLMEAPIKKHRQVRVKSSTIFSAEQATVDAILRNLDETVVDEIIEPGPIAESIPQSRTDPEMEDQVLVPDPYEKYRQQLPYQTDDPAIIEQQALLLEFLITNNICTDKNFEIFIADPDNHKEEATSIVDNLYTVVYADQLDLAEAENSNKTEIDHVPVEDNSPALDVEKTNKTETSLLSVEPQGKLFPIFTQRLQPMTLKSSRHKTNASLRLMTGASGSNQYQIDAGQKAFGARQCQQCGLVYTVHEPEEEQLHKEYHDAAHVLRFKGWIDEDIVAVCPDWAADGRIIRLNERAPSVRLQRLTELINVIDKELGYSSYVVPKTFVAFLAVRKQQIVGLCLVQPLTQAHRFIQVDGIDYFSEETFEASCGVARIWVSSLHRRKGIASKLLRAVQYHTVLGFEIHRDRIAFSSPTDDGRALIRQFTQNDNFLTYQ
ncbi:N-acetyltransferase eco [Drosophila hydei]|uniref:N-acetyltransferase eco n=1 Tax=Drosophila hydei TaxID=7224 RepID=A0A6J1LXW1_DROHY|nr:N-acetyltransferase eco [Drosophila hydei]